MIKLNVGITRLNVNPTILAGMLGGRYSHVRLFEGGWLLGGYRLTNPVPLEQICQAPGGDPLDVWSTASHTRLMTRTNFQ